MAPFDRAYSTFYWSAIVTIALSGTVFELYDIEWCHDLDIWLIIIIIKYIYIAQDREKLQMRHFKRSMVRAHSRSFKPVPFKSLRWGFLFAFHSKYGSCDRLTDRRTSCDGIVHTMHTHRAVKWFCGQPLQRGVVCLRYMRSTECPSSLLYSCMIYNCRACKYFQHF